MSINKLSPFIIIVFGVAFLINSCDTSSPPVGNENSDNKQEQFFAYTDTASSLINRAVSIIRDRNIKENFVQHFVDKKGLPAWDFSSSFTRDNKQILLIPVRQPNVEKVTGVYYFSFDKQGERLDDDWIPRDYEDKWIDKRALETIILGYEQRLFGKKYTDEGARIFDRESISNIYNGLLSKAPSVEQGQCYTSCVSYYCGDWECEYYIDWGEEDKWVSPHGGGGGSGSTGSFYGTIGVDNQSLNNLPELKCVVDKILDTNNMQNLIAEFGMAQTNFDLIFSGSENIYDENGNPILGKLDIQENSTGNTDFILLANASKARGRSSVKTAVTYMHEAMHAEMRRFLRDNADTSTLPNFPGSITEDWENYVETKESIPVAEHDAMSYDEYISFIADAVADFDDHKMSYSYYKALSWEGIWSYDNQWGNKTSQEEQNISVSYNAAVEQLENRPNGGSCL